MNPKKIMFDEGRRNALDLAGRAEGMSGTEIIAEEDHIPAWSETAVYTQKHVHFPVQDKGQVYTIERFSVLYENNLIFCIIIPSP